MNTTAERLKWLRKEKCHKTQEEVGKHVGVGKAAIQKYENGIVTNIPPDKVELLAEALETTPGFILGWENDPEYSRLDERFGEALKKERLKSGMSVKDFARMLEISERALAKYESGKIIPTFNTAVPIAIKLGIPIDEYDPQSTQPQRKTEDEKLIEEIAQMIPSLSLVSKAKALAYIQGLKDNEDNP